MVRSALECLETEARPIFEANLIFCHARMLGLLLRAEPIFPSAVSGGTVAHAISGEELVGGMPALDSAGYLTSGLGRPKA